MNKCPMTVAGAKALEEELKELKNKSKLRRQLLKLASMAI